MKHHVKIPHGCYVVEVRDPAAWNSIAFGFYMRCIPLEVTPVTPSMERDHAQIDEADLLLICSVDPENHVGVGEMKHLLGLSL